MNGLTAINMLPVYVCEQKEKTTHKKTMFKCKGNYEIKKSNEIMFSTFQMKVMPLIM